MKKSLFVVWVVVLLAAACQIEIVEPAVSDASYDVLSAQIEQDEETKTTLDKGNVLWSENDQIIAFMKSSWGHQYQIKPSFVGKTYAEFSKISSAGDDEMEWEDIVAYYPYSESIECEKSNGNYTLDVVLPAEQTYEENSFGNGTFPMVAVSQDNNITFKNVCGGVKLQFKGTQKVKSITLQSKNDEKVSGAAKVTAYINGTSPAIAMDQDAYTKVTLNCGDGVLLNESTVTEFIIALPPVVFTEGFEVTIIGANGEEQKLKTVKQIEISRSTLCVMPEVDIMMTETTAPLQLTYEVTSAETPISLVYNGESYPVAGSGNPLKYIDYGDGTRGTEYSHIYAEPGTYNLRMFFENDVTEIGEKAFYECKELIGVELPEDLKYIGQYSFARSGLKGYLIIPSNDIIIDLAAFIYTGHYDYIYIPSGTTLEDSAQFSYIIVDKLDLEANLPDHGWRSGTSYFYGTSIKDLEIGNQVTFLGSYAFYGAEFKTLKFEQNSKLTDLGEAVFAGNPELETLTLPNVESIGKYAFDLCPNLESINIDSSLSEKRSSTFFSIDGVLYTFINNGRAIFRYPEGKKGDEFKDSSVCALATSAFRDNTYLKIITLGLTDSIGDLAFMGCTNLSQLYGCDYPLPAQVYNYEISFGYGAFRDCISLTEFTIGAAVDVINSSVFNNCSSLKSIYCKPVVPPILNDDSADMPVFGGNAPDRLIYVPKESVDAYKSAPGWSNYKDYIVAEDFVDTKPYVNLSENGTANCYIVSEAGFYNFTPTKGNSNESVGEIASAEVLWESFGTDITPNVGDLVKNVKYEDDVICFETPSEYKEGNAVIAAKDASGTILWSWHIWLTDQPEGQEYFNDAGTMMDRNLGATSATPGDVGALGLHYQWGRKDPFLGSSSISSRAKVKSTITWPSSVTSNSSNGTIEYTTSQPTTFIKENLNSYNYDWYYTGSSTGNTRWTTSDKTKSVYDPCPSGWRVPDGGSNGVWSKALGSSSSLKDSSVYDSTNYGMNLSGKFGSASTIWYPVSGYLVDYIGAEGLVNPGFSGGYWSASYNNGSSGFAYYLYILSDYGSRVNPSSSSDCACGYPVRCIQE